MFTKERFEKTSKHYTKWHFMLSLFLLLFTFRLSLRSWKESEKNISFFCSNNGLHVQFMMFNERRLLIPSTTNQVIKLHFYGWKSIGNDFIFDVKIISLHRGIMVSDCRQVARAGDSRFSLPWGCYANEIKIYIAQLNRTDARIYFFLEQHKMLHIRLVVSLAH